ncbi:MAG: peptidase M16 [Flavobacteriales bacterium]|nr:peptidase M16 [Flavobacteriales bacterium]
MKKIIFIFISICSVSFGQIDRTIAPQADEAPVIEIGEYQEFKLKNGLQVILVENHKLPVVSFQLSTDYTPFLENEKAGLTDFTSQMIGAGTSSMNKAELDEELDYLGATFFPSGINGFYASSLKKHENKLLDLISDIIFNPSFPEEEFDKIKKQYISALEADKSSPDAISSNISSLINYGENHPYGELTSDKTLDNITIEDIRELYNNYFRPNISYLIIVGDMTLKEAKKISKKYFSKWEEKDVPNLYIDNFEKPKGNQVHFIHKEGSAQSVIKITYPLNLKPNDSDIISSKVMNSILGGGFSGRLNLNLREDKGYTYGARSSTSSDKFIGNFSASASVRNEVTDSAVTEFLFELNEMTIDLVKTEEIELAKNYMTGTFALSLEEPRMAARLALNTKINNLNPNYYKNYLKNLNNVSKEDVFNSAKKYIDPNNCNIVIVGDKEIASSLIKFDSDGEITFYNTEGKILKTKPIPNDIDINFVLDKNISALGGKEKINKTQDIQLKYEAEISGTPMKLDMEVAYKQPNLFYMSMNAGNFGEIMGMKYNGQKCVTSGMQGAKELIDEEIKKEMDGFYPFPIIKSEELQLSYELKEIEEINGKDAFKVIQTDQFEQKKTMYFDTETYYLVKEIYSEDSDGISVQTIQEYSNYINYNGLYFAKDMTTTQIMEQGTQSFKLNLIEVSYDKINEGKFE